MTTRTPARKRPATRTPYMLTFKGQIAAQNDGLIDARPLVTLTDKGRSAAKEEETK